MQTLPLAEMAEFWLNILKILEVTAIISPFSLVTFRFMATMP